MRRWKRAFTVLTFIFGMALTVGGAASEQATLAELTVQSLLGNASPGPMDGVEFFVEEVFDTGTDLALAQALPNVIPYQCFASRTEGGEPVENFRVGVGQMYLNTRIVVLNHAVRGIVIFHALFSHTHTYYWQQKEPAWVSGPGERWRFWIQWYSVPDIPGSYTYFAIVIPFDLDGLFFNPRATSPVIIAR